MKTAQFDYHLPPELIAQQPLAERSASRLLVVRKQAGTIEHRQVDELPELLPSGGVLVTNNSRVIPARLAAERRTGGKVELLLIEPLADQCWLCMVRSSKAIRANESLQVHQRGSEGSSTAVAQADVAGGRGVFRFTSDFAPERFGVPPLPPYIQRETQPEDWARYQTVYAQHDGSVAAPTAGLHFTEDLLHSLDQRGIVRRHVTLHVGPGTFVPVRSDDVAAHCLEEERYEVDPMAAAAIAQAKADARPVIAVGTTAVRTLESTAGQAGQGRTSLYIYPGYEFRVVDMLMTNFHLPRSSLLMLVSAFAGHELVMKAYAEAVKARYRFYSYGDAMLIL